MARLWLRTIYATASSIWYIAGTSKEDTLSIPALVIKRWLLLDALHVSKRDGYLVQPSWTGLQDLDIGEAQIFGVSSSGLYSNAPCLSGLPVVNSQVGPD